MSILGGSASSHTCEGQHNCTTSDPPVREVDDEVLVGSWVPYLAVCVLAYALIFFACCKARRRGLCRRCSKRASATAPDPIADVAPHLVEIECSGEEALADSECSICLAEFEPSTQQKPCVLTQQKACGHWHHTACLKQWYGTQLSAGRCRSCPLCKTPVDPPAAAATAPVTATPAAARAIELYNSYPRVVM